jgi:hypothetical protein
MMQRTVEHSTPPTHLDMIATTQKTRKTRRRIPNEKWEEQRPLITRLYQAERRSLNEVMQILKREDWDPTYVQTDRDPFITRFPYVFDFRLLTSAA